MSVLFFCVLATAVIVIHGHFTTFGTKSLYADLQQEKDQDKSDPASAFEQLQLHCPFCRIRFLQWILRHGTRNPSLKQIRKWQTLLQEWQTVAELLPQWMQAYVLPYEAHGAPNSIVSRGITELMDLGTRMRQQWGQQWPKEWQPQQFPLHLTWKARTQQSARA